MRMRKVFGFSEGELEFWKGLLGESGKDRNSKMIHRLVEAAAMVVVEKEGVIAMMGVGVWVLLHP